MNLLVTLAHALFYRKLTQLAARYQKDFVVMERLSRLTTRHAEVKKRLEHIPTQDRCEEALAAAHEALRAYRRSGLSDLGACRERADADCPEHAEYTCDFAKACPYLRDLRVAEADYNTWHSEDAELARLDKEIEQTVES